MDRVVVRPFFGIAAVHHYVISSMPPVLPVDVCHVPTGIHEHVLVFVYAYSRVLVYTHRVYSYIPYILYIASLLPYEVKSEIKFQIRNIAIYLLHMTV